MTYTAWDLQAFARDLGYSGAPFTWDAARRLQLRCELDALYFHLYGISDRADVAYMLDTFPIVKRNDERVYGEFRSKRLILQLHEAMGKLPKLLVPAPMNAAEAYPVPDLRGWRGLRYTE